MRIEGRETFPAHPEIVWSLIGEPGMVERLLPGFELFEPVAPDQYRLELNLRIGKATELLSAMLNLERVVPTVGFDFRAAAQGQSGALNLHGHIALEDQGADCTALSYVIDIDGDQFPAVSPRMLETTARAFARRSLEALDKQVAIRTRVYTTSAFRPEPAPAALTRQNTAILRRLLAVASVLLTLLLLWRGLARRRTRQIAREVAAQLERPEAGQLPDAPKSEGAAGRSSG
jgi:carbon monoxide dehydrogenase subunit G